MSTDTNEEKAFRTEVRNWLTRHKRNITWLASWIEKSENTVRNFIYGKKPISKSNMEKIQAIMYEYNDSLEENFCGDLVIKTGHRLDGMNPDFDPSQNKINTKIEPLCGFYISEKTSKLIRETNSYQKIEYDSFERITVYTLGYDLYEEINDHIRYTIRNYIEQEKCDFDTVLKLERPEFYIDIEHLYLYKVIIPHLDMKNYAPIASAISGQGDVNSFLEDILYNYLITLSQKNLANYLGL